jgi:gliding motility-associated-like protein
MPAVDLRSENNSNVLCLGSDIRLYVNNSDSYSSGATYVWYKDSSELVRGVNMYEYYVATSGMYSVLIFEPDGCLSISDTVTVSVVDLLQMDSIKSSNGMQLIYNESTDLTASGVTGGISPYIYTWYKKSESETSWTEVYSSQDSTFTTGSLAEPTCFAVTVISSDPLLTCNLVTDTICIDVLRIKLKLEFLDTEYSVCNSNTDSISIRLTNSMPGIATNVLIEFKSEGALPPLNPVLIDSLAGNDSVTIVLYLPENTSMEAYSGLLKAEIISCIPNVDADTSTHYGNWKNDRNWNGEPQEADEDMLNLTVYPNVRLTSPLLDTICSGETFTYEPQANMGGVSFSWTRDFVSDIIYTSNDGNGEGGMINEGLENIDNIPVTIKYIYTLTADFCPTPITDTLTVVVLPKGKLTLSHTPADGSVIVLGTPVTITATLEGVAAKTYTFIYANNISEQLSNQYKIYVFNKGVENEVYVEVENEYGCMLSGVETFNLNYNLPNLITPNENINNRLLKNYDIQVFNRWGSQLYRGKEGWDGKYKGTLVASGTYLYVVHLTLPDGKILTLKQSVFVKY